MQQNNRLTGRRIGAAAVLAAVTTCGGLAFAPAAFADSTVASATTYSTAHSATHSAAYRPVPDIAMQCYQILQLEGYTVTTARGIACNVAALGKPNHAAAIAACTGTMLATGVNPTVAAAACLVGAAQG